MDKEEDYIMIKRSVFQDITLPAFRAKNSLWRHED